MKQLRRNLAILLVLVVFASLALTACTAPRYSFSDEAIRSAVENAAKSQMKSVAGNGKYADYKVKTEKQGRKQAVIITVDEIVEKDGYWVANGTSTLVSNTDKSEIDVEFEMTVELLDYVSESPILKFVDFKIIEE